VSSRSRLLAAVALVALTAPCARAAAPPAAASLFLSPTGSDDAPCSAAAPCATLRRAFALAQPGQVVELAAGTYPGQSIGPAGRTGTAHVVFRPAQGATVAFSGRLSLDGAAHLTLQGFQLARPGPGDRSLFVDACTNDVTLQNLSGETFFVLEGTSHVLFQGGSWGGYGTPGAQDSGIGTSGAAGPGRSCGGAVAPPARDIVFDGVTFHDVFWNVPEAAWGGSHPDCLEINGYVDGVTIRNSRFQRCASTFLMIGPDQGDIANVTVENNVFTDLGRESWYGIQITSGGKPSRCAGIAFRDNTYLPRTPDASTWPNGPIRTDCETVAGAAGVSVADNVFARAPPANECARYTAPPFGVSWKDNVFLAGACGSGARGLPVGYTPDLGQAPEAAAVRAAFKAAAAGTKPARIAADLSRTRTGGRRWSSAAIRALLAEPAYAGGVGARGSLPHLVTKRVWEAAQG
jgi:hypothetical protein